MLGPFTLGYGAFQHASQQKCVHTPYIMPQRRHQHEAMPDIVRVPQQVELPRSEPLRHSSHIYQHAYDVACAHESVVGNRGLEVVDFEGPGWDLHEDYDVHEGNCSQEAESQEDKPAEGAVLWLLKAFRQRHYEDQPRTNRNPSQKHPNQL